MQNFTELFNVGASDGGGVLNALEAQRLIEHLQPIGIADIGSPKWMKQRELIEQLNMQAHHNVVSNHDEFIVEAFISFEKVPVLIHELIAIETWKLRVAPLIEDELVKNCKNSMKPYLLHYHEATISNLLECMFYHKDAVLGADDFLLELIDYCQRKVTLMILTHDSEYKKRSTEEIAQLTDRDVFEDQRSEIQLNCCMHALTILRYITDNMSFVSPSVVSRVLDTHDSVISLVYLVEKAPWKKRNKSAIYKYINSRWVEVNHEDSLKVTQHEAQVWLAINNLIVDPECRRKYEYNSFRKDTILKLKRYINDILIDQIPVLLDLRQSVEELHIMNPPEAANHSMLIIEHVPELRNSMMKNDFEEIAQMQAQTLFDEDENEKREEMMRMAKLFAEMVDLVDIGGEQTEEQKLL